MEEATRMQREGVIECLWKQMFLTCQKLPSLKFRDWEVKWRHLSTIIIIITTLYPFFEDPFEGKMHFKAHSGHCFNLNIQLWTLAFQLSWTYDCTIQETVFYWNLPTIATDKSLQHLGTQKRKYVFVQTAAILNHIITRQTFLLICPACS